MKTAPDEVRNLVISEKNDTVNEVILMPTLMVMIVILIPTALLLIMNLLLTLLFRVLGPWQKRPYNFLNGIVKIIQNNVGKCIYLFIL